MEIQEKPIFEEDQLDEILAYILKHGSALMRSNGLYVSSNLALKTGQMFSVTEISPGIDKISI